MASWLDFFNPPGFMGMQGPLSPSFQPGTYDYFRGLYPPAVRPPPRNIALPSPVPSAGRLPYDPMPPMSGAPPGPVPPLAPKVSEHDDLPPGVQQYYANATKVAPPMMGRNPAPATEPPMLGDANTLPAINSVPYSRPQAPSPADATPDWWDRHGQDLSSILLQTGAGMLTAPPGASFGQGVGQGLGQGFQYAATLTDRNLDRRLKKAQVGKVEAETQARGLLREFAQQANLPTGVALSLMLSPEKAAEILEKYDPAMKAAFLKFTEEKSGATAKGSFPYDIAKAAAGATNVGIKVGTEYQAKLDNLAKFEGIANDPARSAAERQNARDMAQSIRRDLTQKDSPPKAWVDEISGMAQGVKAAQELKALVGKHGVISLDPAARAEIAQQYSYVLNAMKKSEGFGAALTGNEQAILEAGVRNPNDFFNNILIGSQTHIKLLDKYIAYTQDRAQTQQNMWRSGDLPPSLRGNASPPPGFKLMTR